ncbi:MAG: hypothetical protein M3Y75_06235 [Actinomycetota bacterium]|nr:hypothetical protein [Actinomycetota bacterium]
MKHLKMLGLAAVAAVALTALTAGSASATTLEIGGVAQNQKVTLSQSLKPGSSITISRTDGSLANTCTASTTHYETTTWGLAKVGWGTPSITYSNCTRPISVLKSGSGSIEHIASTTDGTVESSGAEITVGSPFGTLNCQTGAGVDVGRLTGTASSHAELHVNAVLNCGFLVPSARLQGSYVTTSPTGLGVVP